MAIKSEFKRRLDVLRYQIDKALYCDSLDFGFFPALYNVLSYMWCKSDKELQKK